MRSVYLVAYDICDDKRVKQIFKIMRGFGEHLQYSVFRCELSDANLVRMKSTLTDAIKHDSDQILIFRLGPADGTYTVQMETLGVPYTAAVQGALIV